MCWEHGAVEPPWFQALIEMQLVQRIVAPAWQGLSAMLDSAYSPLPPLVPDKAGKKALQNRRWFSFERACIPMTCAHLCYWHFLMCLSKYEEKREQCAYILWVWWQVHVICMRCICFYFGRIWTNHDSCTTVTMMYFGSFTSKYV